MTRERSRCASSRQYSGNACSAAPAVRKKFGCEPAASTIASPVNVRPSVVVTVRAAGSSDSTCPSLTSTFSSSAKSLRSEKAMSLDASCEVATW